MSKTTAMNEVRVREVLEEYLGRRKVENVISEILEVIQKESKHNHNGEIFYVHKDEAGTLVISTESIMDDAVKRILNLYLEEDDVQECFEQFTAGVNLLAKANNIETISIPGANSSTYVSLLDYIPANDAENNFKINLKEAIANEIQDFEVLVNDPSFENGKLQFVAGKKPAVGYSYNEIEKLAEENGLRIGTKYEYILFLATMINRLIADGWSESDAWKAVCYDSKELGHYRNSADAKGDFESTGSRKIVGKCDLANTYKILAKDENAGGFWLAGGCYFCNGDSFPLAYIGLYNGYDDHYDNSVGWFVL